MYCEYGYIYIYTIMTYKNKTLKFNVDTEILLNCIKIMSYNINAILIILEYVVLPSTLYLSKKCVIYNWFFSVECTEYRRIKTQYFLYDTIKHH